MDDHTTVVISSTRRLRCCYLGERRRRRGAAVARVRRRERGVRCRDAVVRAVRRAELAERPTAPHAPRCCLRPRRRWSPIGHRNRRGTTANMARGRGGRRNTHKQRAAARRRGGRKKGIKRRRRRRGGCLAEVVAHERARRVRVRAEHRELAAARERERRAVVLEEHEPLARLPCNGNAMECNGMQWNVSTSPSRAPDQKEPMACVRRVPGVRQTCARRVPGVCQACARRV